MKIKLSLFLISTILLIAAATTAAKFIGASKSANNVPNRASEPTTIEPVRTAQATDEAPSDIQVVLLTLRSEGFEPAEMQLSAGEYLLVVRNRTGLDEVDVWLVRENGEHFGQAKVGRRRKDWKQRFKLTPGTYLLTETNRPDWTMRIVVSR